MDFLRRNNENKTNLYLWILDVAAVNCADIPDQQAGTENSKRNMPQDDIHKSVPE
jgi:hypothetical protein